MSAKKSLRRSVPFFILSSFLVIALIVGFFVWRNYKYKLVNKKIEKLVTGKSKGLYQLNYQHLVIDEVQGNITAEEVELNPDSLVYQTMNEQKTVPPTIFYIRIPKLTITGVKTPKALLNKEISAHIIRIQDAEIEIRMGKGEHEKNTNFKNILASEQYRQLIGQLKSIHADSVVLENANLTLRDQISKDIRCQATGLSIRFAGLAIDTIKQNDSSRLLFTNEQAVHCALLVIPQKNKEYEFRMTGFDYDSKAGRLHTDQIRFIPLLSETAFTKANRFAKDRFNIVIGSVDLKHLDRQFLLHHQFVADTLQMTNASFHIFRDKSALHDSVDRTHDFPQEALMKLSFPVYIGKIILKDSYIEYKEKNDKSDSSGKVAFFHIQCSITNVTNMADSIGRNTKMQLHFYSSFLDKTPFTADLNMRLNDRNGNFLLNANLGKLNAVELNPLLKPMALSELDKGEINSLQYHLKATNTEGKGKLILKYNELKVKLLKKDDDKNKYKTKFLPTLAAGIVLKKSNPQNGQMRIGQIEFKRDIHRSIFNFMWKSLLAGIKQVAL